MSVLSEKIKNFLEEMIPATSGADETNKLLLEMLSIMKAINNENAMLRKQLDILDRRLSEVEYRVEYKQ